MEQEVPVQGVITKRVVQLAAPVKSTSSSPFVAPRSKNEAWQENVLILLQKIHDGILSLQATLEEEKEGQEEEDIMEEEEVLVPKKSKTDSKQSEGLRSTGRPKS